MFLLKHYQVIFLLYLLLGEALMQLPTPPPPNFEAKQLKTSFIEEGSLSNGLNFCHFHFAYDVTKVLRIHQDMLAFWNRMQNKFKLPIKVNLQLNGLIGNIKDTLDDTGAILSEIITWFGMPKPDNYSTVMQHTRNERSLYTMSSVELTPPLKTEPVLFNDTMPTERGNQTINRTYWDPVWTDIRPVPKPTSTTVRPAISTATTVPAHTVASLAPTYTSTPPTSAATTRKPTVLPSTSAPKASVAKKTLPSPSPTTPIPPSTSKTTPLPTVRPVSSTTTSTMTTTTSTSPTTASTTTTTVPSTTPTPIVPETLSPRAIGQLRPRNMRPTDPSNIPIRHTRYKRQLALLGSVFGLGVSIYNSFQISQLRQNVAELFQNQETIKANQDLLLVTLRAENTAIKTLESNLAKIHSAFAELVTDFQLVTMTMDWADKFQQVWGAAVHHHTVVAGLRDSLESLLHGFFDATILDPLELAIEWEKAKAAAELQGYTFIVNQLSEIFNSKVSYKVEEQTIHVFVHVPIQKVIPMKLYRYLPIPIYLDKQLVRLVDPDGHSYIAADAQKGSGLVLTAEQLQQCTKVRTNYQCPQQGLTRNNIRDTCLGALLLGQKNNAKDKCQVEYNVAAAREQIEKLGPKSIYYATSTNRTITLICNSREMTKVTIPSGAYLLTIPKHCMCQMEEYTFTPEESFTNEMPNLVHLEDAHELLRDIAMEMHSNLQPILDILKGVKDVKSRTIPELHALKQLSFNGTWAHFGTILGCVIAPIIFLFLVFVACKCTGKRRKGCCWTLICRKQKGEVSKTVEIEEGKLNLPMIRGQIRGSKRVKFTRAPSETSVHVLGKDKATAPPLYADDDEITIFLDDNQYQNILAQYRNSNI